jgi:hypothetical protein
LGALHRIFTTAIDDIELHPGGEEEDESDNSYGSVTLLRSAKCKVVNPLRKLMLHRWESGFKLDIPKFSGNLQPEEFLDWVAAVEEILDFKGVPEDRQVSLVATKFWGRAAAWWQQLKQTRVWQGS